MPNSSPITRNGNGWAKPSTRSTTASGPASGELVEQLVDDAHDGRFERGDPRRSEGPRHELAQTGVVVTVDGEHVAGERRAGKSFVDDVRVLVERGDHVLREPGVTERLAGGVVTDHEPRLVPVGQAHLVHRALRAHLGEQWVRVALRRGVPRAPGCRSRHASPCSLQKPEHTKAMCWIRPLGPASA